MKCKSNNGIFKKQSILFYEREEDKDKIISFFKSILDLAELEQVIDEKISLLKNFEELTPGGNNVMLTLKLKNLLTGKKLYDSPKPS